MNIWASVAPKNKAGKLFGVGNDQRRFRRGNLLRGSSSTAASSSVDPNVEKLLEENRQLKETVSRHERVLQDTVSRNEQMFAWFMQQNPDFFKNMGPPGGFPGGQGGGGGDGSVGAGDA